MRLQSLAGWLWADLMLGMFAIFMVANTVGPKPPPSPAPTAAVSASPTASESPRATPSPGVNRTKTTITVSAKGSVLLGSDAAAIDVEQSRILQEANSKLNELFPGTSKRAALVLAYGYHANPTLGELLARTGTAKFTSGIFSDAAIATYHFQIGGDAGSSIQLDIYFYFD